MSVVLRVEFQDLPATRKIRSITSLSLSISINISLNIIGMVSVIGAVRTALVRSGRQ